MQMEILECLAQAPSAADLPEYFPQAQTRLHQALANLRAGRVPLEKLLVAQKLSRALEAYRTPSPAARAATQLQAVGKIVKPGQRVRFLYMRGRPGVYAWDLPTPPDPRALDLAYYDKFMRRAANTILEPLGMKEKQLRYQVQCTLKVHCTLLP